MQTQPIRILVADDHDLLRVGIAAALAAFDDLCLVGEATTGQEAVEQCERLQPDVVLMDMRMPEMDGVTATRLIHRQQPETKIVALSNFDDKELVEGALKAGAAGYLLKNVSIDELASSIRLAHMGRSTLSPEIVSTLVEGPQHPYKLDFGLTRREMQVLRLLVKGFTNAQIAENLLMSRSTARNHVSSILAKLNTDSRTKAVAIALRSGLVLD